MAIYDYRCKKCGHTFERILKIADNKLPESEGCPECGKMAVSQVILSTVGFCDPVRLGITKIPQGFTDVLKGIKAANRGSNINIRGN